MRGTARLKRKEVKGESGITGEWRGRKDDCGYSKGRTERDCRRNTDGAAESWGGRCLKMVD